MSRKSRPDALLIADTRRLTWPEENGGSLLCDVVFVLTKDGAIIDVVVQLRRRVLRRRLRAYPAKACPGFVGAGPSALSADSAATENVVQGFRAGENQALCQVF